MQISSQKEIEGISEEKDEVPLEIKRGTNDPFEPIHIRNLQDNTFTQERKADSMLQHCFEKVTEEPLIPERPERYLIEKDLLYRKILVNPRNGGENLQKQLVVLLKY